MNLSGNTIFIAGATSGIGRGLAERFADAGNHVIIAGRRQHLVDEIVAGDDNIEGLVLDVNDALSIEAAVSIIKTSQTGRRALLFWISLTRSTSAFEPIWVVNVFTRRVARP